MPKYNYGHTDRPTHEDSFHITQYIDGLASFIQRCNTPITVSIQGDWGTGKTSMMEMVYDKIKNNKG